MRLARTILPPVRWAARHLGTALHGLYRHYCWGHGGAGHLGQRELAALGAAVDTCCRMEDALSVVLGLATWPPEDDLWMAESLAAVMRENAPASDAEVWN